MNKFALNGQISSEVLNLYALVTWMGLAHFVYAYHGQGKALKRTPSKILPFVLALAAAALVLIALRAWLGWMVL